MGARTEKRVKVKLDKVISTPLEWWGLEDLAPGETVVLSRLSAGLVQARRPLPRAGMTPDDVLDAFGDLLRQQGYNSREQVVGLMQEIKHEVAEEWPGRDPGA